MNRLIDPIEIQRLVDGSLDDDEQNALIQWAEEWPENWKEIAFAFIEQSNLQRVWEPNPPEVSSTVSTTSRDQPQPSDQLPMEHRNMQGRSWGLAIAAAILITLTNGFLIYRYRVRPGRSISPVDVANTSLIKPPTTVVTPVQPRNLAENQLEYWASTVSTPLIQPELKELLARRGVITVEQPVIYFFEDGEGNDYMIPNREAVLISHQK